AVCAGLACAPASALRAAPGGTAIAPVIAVGNAGASTTGASTLTLGPPVMTGTGSWLLYSLAPSPIDATIAYECFEAMPESSYGNSNATGTEATPSIRCSPMTPPASGPVVWSTSVTTPTASPARATGSGHLMFPGRAG